MVFQLVTIFLLAVKGGDGQVSEHVSLWVRVCVCVCMCDVRVCARARVELAVALLLTVEELMES